MVATTLLVLSGSFLDNAFPATSLGVTWWTAISTAVLLPTVFLKHLSDLSWVALLSNLGLVAAVLTVLGFCFKESASWQLGNIPGWDTEGVFFSVPIITFGYDCHVVLPLIEDSMANRSSFDRVMGLSFATSFVLKLVFAVCCFLTFEHSIEEAIVNNMPDGVLRYTVCFLLALSIVCNYAQLVIVIIEVLNDTFAPQVLFATKEREVLWYIVSRLLIVFFNSGWCVINPKFRCYHSNSWQYFQYFNHLYSALLVPFVSETRPTPLVGNRRTYFHFDYFHNFWFGRHCFFPKRACSNLYNLRKDLKFRPTIQAFSTLMRFQNTLVFVRRSSFWAEAECSEIF